MAKRIKKMPLEQFQEVMKRNWKTVKLVGSAIPEWLRNIPENTLNSVVVSGTNIQGLNSPMTKFLLVKSLAVLMFIVMHLMTLLS